MPAWSIFLIVGLVLLTLSFPIFFFLKVFLPNWKATKNRAQKIDPSVKTMADANFVLSNELAKNIGSNKKTTYCKHCGKEIDNDSQFCKHCGKNQ